MKNLVIIGAGGCGREVLQWVRQINLIEQRWNIKGFLDDDKDALNGKECDLKVIAGIDEYEFEDDDEFICCIGNGSVRNGVIDKVRKKGGRFATIIHPTAVLANSCHIGEGVILYPFSFVSDNVEIGDGCIINTHSSVGHDSRLGVCCTISAHCDITGACCLGNRVFLGSGANMIPQVTIGNDAFVCAGATVMSNVKEGVKVFGIPAKKIAL